MERPTTPPKANSDGFPENFLRDAYENIFKDSSHFYTLLYDQFTENSDITSINILVLNQHPKTQTTSNIITIILADDDEDDRIFFKEALQELDIKTQIKVVKDGVELMEHLTSKVNPLPHIIFLDINMPKKNGIECLVEIRNNDLLKNIPIAIYSTSASEEDIQETYLKGANFYIKKPNDFALIKKILKGVISNNWDLRRRSRETYFITI